MSWSAAVLRQLTVREAILGNHDMAWVERRWQERLAEHGHTEPSTPDRSERTDASA